MARVRLRSRPPRAPEPEWIRGAPASRWTTVGNLGSTARGLVDPAGLVAVAGRSWSLDWWIGAEDRWHVPAREVAVRQSLVGSSPVVETRLRVPSGDAVQRVYAARGPRSEDVLVIEIANDTKVPFAVALGVRPYDLSAPGRIDRVELDGASVLIDGHPAVRLPRSPGRIALGTAASGDAAEVVLSGGAEPVGPAAADCGAGYAHAALVFPLAHTAVLRVVVPLGPPGIVEPHEVPDAEDVASGWQVHARQGARFEVPSRTLREALTASTRHLLLGDGRPTTAAALDLVGFPGEAAGILAADPTSLTGTDAPGAALHALGWHWRLGRDVAAARRMARLAAALVPALNGASGVDAARGRAALPAVAELLDAAGEALGAADVRAVIEASAPPPAVDLDALLASAGPTWTWPSGPTGHDLDVNAALVTAVRHQLVEEVDGGLALSPGVPEAWLGQGWEVHGAPTAHGRLSYAIRWHGERPALLWELERHAGHPAVRLTTPTLDAGWSSHEPEGEALLAPVAVPERPRERRGLTIPVTIEPMPRTGR